MVGPSTECQIRLYRDSLTTPWGFRLQGGKDFKVPLSVQRVFVGSPADGDLQRGDAIVAINNYDATQLTHKQAMDVIKESGGALSMRVRRYLEPHQPASTPTAAPPRTSHMQTPQYFRSRPMEVGGGSKAPQQFGVDYSRGFLPAPNVIPTAVRGGGGPTYRDKAMLNQVQQSLQNALWSPTHEDEDYHTRSVNELTNVFVEKEQVPEAPPEPRRSVKDLKQQYNIIAQENPQFPSTHHMPSERPPWLGSLKSSGGPKPWEMSQGPQTDKHVLPVHQPRVQHFHQGPGGEVTYEQHALGDPGSESAQVKHLQYNSPIGLYSQDNVQEVLEGQTRGKPGHGTLQVTSASGGPGGKKVFDPKSSDVLRMIQEEESHRRGPVQQSARGPVQQSARYVGPDQQQQMHYGGYMDHNKQGPAMERLAHQYSGAEQSQQHHHAPPQAAAAGGAPDYGVSDF